MCAKDSIPPPPSSSSPVWDPSVPVPRRILLESEEAKQRGFPNKRPRSPSGVGARTSELEWLAEHGAIEGIDRAAKLGEGVCCCRCDDAGIEKLVWLPDAFVDGVVFVAAGEKGGKNGFLFPPVAPWRPGERVSWLCSAAIDASEREIHAAEAAVPLPLTSGGRAGVVWCEDDGLGAGVVPPLRASFSQRRLLSELFPLPIAKINQK